MIFEVEGPGGKIIKVEGPEDATDDELIQIARSHVAQQKPVAAAPPVASQKSSVATNPDKLIPGQLPELSPQKDLSKQVQQKSTEEVAQPVAQAASPSMFESLGKGNFGEAWKSIPEDTRNMIEYGTLPVLGVAALAKAAKDYYNSPPSIKARTIGNGNPPAPATSSAPPTPSAPPAPSVSNAPPAPNYSPKEAKLAQDIENKYGYKWSDIKNSFGLSDVPVTDPTHGEIMANSFTQQQKVAAPTTPNVTAETTIATPNERVVNGVKMTEAQYQSWITDPENVGKSPQSVVEKSNLPTTPKAEVAPVTPAAPPAEAPKAAVAPEAVPEAPPMTAKEAKKLEKSLASGKNQYSNLLGGKQYPEHFNKSWDVLTEHVFSEGAPKGQGGSPQYWDKAVSFMKDNPDKFPKESLQHLQELAAKYGKPTDQAGFARLGAMAGAAGAGLFALGAYHAYKHGKETGDWTPAGELGLTTVAGAINPALMFATYMSGAGEGEQQALNKIRYEEKVGGGRGITPAQAYNVGAGRGVAPPSAYRR
jgi:hypothetical protein